MVQVNDNTRPGGRMVGDTLVLELELSVCVTEIWTMSADATVDAEGGLWAGFLANDA